MIDSMEKAASVSFVQRIARVLISLSEGNNNVTDIARNCNLSNSTTHRLLNILRDPQFTIFDPSSHHYYLGPLITRLSARPKATHQYLQFASFNEMKRLSDLSEETISLDLVMGIQFIHIYDISSKHGLRVLPDSMDIQPIEPLGAAQKILLSQLTERELKLTLKISALWYPKSSPKSEKDFMDTLAQIRNQGFAVSTGEGIVGSTGVSTPVSNYFCPVALTIIGPEKRIKERLSELKEELLKSARILSRIMQEIAHQV
jgi:IclR family transcriptional regulator, KDG regulon repressor